MLCHHQPSGRMLNRTHFLYLRLKALLMPQSIKCVTSLWQLPHPHVCSQLHSFLCRAFILCCDSHLRQTGGLWDFWVLWTYLQFWGDALTLCHELRDYLCLLPQILQLLRDMKEKTDNQTATKCVGVKEMFQSILFFLPLTDNNICTCTQEQSEQWWKTHTQYYLTAESLNWPCVVTPLMPCTFPQSLFLVGHLRLNFAGFFPKLYNIFKDYPELNSLKTALTQRSIKITSNSFEELMGTMNNTTCCLYNKHNPTVSEVINRTLMSRVISWTVTVTWSNFYEHKNRRQGGAGGQICHLWM